MTNDELQYILNAIKEIAIHAEEWSGDYKYSSANNEFYHLSEKNELNISDWFVIQPSDAVINT